MAKNVVVLSDGTGNSASAIWRTNVWRVFESLDLSTRDQIAQYDDGVGSSAFKPLALLGGVFGYGLKRNVLDLYTFLCRNYREGDRIYAFGFSRGAFTIRVLLGLILHQGLVPFTSEGDLQRKARAAYRAYRGERYHTVHRIEMLLRMLRNLALQLWDAAKGLEPYDQTKNIQLKSIRFVGVWDTVAAYGLPIEEMTRGMSQWIWPLELPDRELGKKVEQACHALAIDDARTTFHPVLWSERGEKVPPARDDGCRYLEDERINQVWFCGMHSNVGGGYPDDSLSYISLYWIMQEAKQCGLRLKEAPDAEPDAMRWVASAQDIDGRLYDSRAGLGGYYRYGPRKIADLCRMRFSRKKEDAVEIAIPKIHESALARIRAGSQGYVPIGLPSTYAVAMRDGRIVEGDENPFESTAEARARSEQQEHVWNLIWQRRVVYFLTIAASLHLAFFPLFHQSIPAREFSSHIRWFSELVRIAGAFLPWFAKWWVNSFAANPWWFAAGIAALVLFIGWGIALSGRISDQMRQIWDEPRTGDAGSFLPTGGIFRIRTSTVYRWFIRVNKRHVIPFFSALALIYLALALFGHFAFHAQDSAGFYCKGSNKPYRLKPGERREAVFDIRSLCWATGWELEEGRRYRLLLEQTTPWKNADFVTDIDGFEIAELQDFSDRVYMFVTAPWRRVFLRPWFRVIARIGERGTDEYFVDRDKRVKQAPDRLQVAFPTRRSGELFLYVNDAVVGLPWWTDIFYRNNTGTARVVLKRLPD